LSEQTAIANTEAVFEVKVGHPAEQIVRLAHKEQVDAIVMGAPR